MERDGDRKGFSVPKALPGKRSQCSPNVAAAGLVIMLLLAAANLQAATITVNTSVDELNSDGDCSLREAIQAANTDTAVDACTAGSAADSINLPAGTYTLQRAGSGEDLNQTGDLDISTEVTLTGAGASSTIIDGDASDRVFDVYWGPATISQVTVRNGRLTNGSHGGGIYVNTWTQLTLDRVTVQSNVLSGTSAAGGGIYNFGTLTVGNCTISSNTAVIGGGICNAHALTMSNTTVSNNTSTDIGGGIYNQNNTNGMTLTNVTVSGNQAGGYYGGGLAALSQSSTTMTNCTITGNTATEPNGHNIYVAGGVSITLKNTIVNSSGDNNCHVPGSLVSAGNNMESGNTCNLILSTDITGKNPLLGTLADNGGYSWTHAISRSSPAFNGGTNTGCPATDQRDKSRPQGPSCDIGAYELLVGGPAWVPVLLE